MLAATLVLSGAGCATNRQDMFEPAGQQAKEIDGLLKLSGYMAAAVGVVVAGAVVAIVLRFRRTKAREDLMPDQVHGNMRAEIGWTIAPLFLLGVLVVPTVRNIIDLEARADDAMEVVVEGQQWWWQFTYDMDGDGLPEITTANEMVIPVGQTVHLDLRSNDVVHSFWIPALNGKRDAVPGREHFWKLHADEAGVFWGQCAEFCGLAHADMRMRVVALERADYERWVAEQVQPAAIPPEGDSPERRGYEVFTGNCVSCHVVRGDAATEGALDRSQVPLRAGIAPDLTHLLSRTSFAGSLFPMYLEGDDLNLPALRAWVQDAPAQKPMHPENQQGMVSFAATLSEDDVDALLAYLTTLGPAPMLPEGVTAASASKAP